MKLLNNLKSQFSINFMGLIISIPDLNTATLCVCAAVFFFLVYSLNFRWNSQLEGNKTLHVGASDA